MAWLLLFLAGTLEVAWPIGFKYSYGFTKLVPTVLTGLALMLSFFLMSISAKTLPIGTVYAVWTGIGVLGTSVCGILIFKESYDLMRVGCIMLIFVGVVGLKLVAKE